MKSTLALTLLMGVLTSAASASAQEQNNTRPDDTLLIIASGGVGSWKGGFGGMKSVEIFRGKTVFEVRTAAVTDESWVKVSVQPAESTTDVGFMIGRASRSRHGMVFAAVGLLGREDALRFASPA